MTSGETDLMLRVRKGDREAFGNLFEQFQAPIFNYFLRLSGNRATAEDLTQDLFLRVWKGSSSYRPTAKVSTWLFTIAHNLWINASTKWSRTPPPSPTPAIAPTPEQHELRARILQAINALPDPEREVYVMNEFGGMSYAEIAEVLGIPVGTVKSRMFYACERLKERLKPDVAPE